MPHLSCVSLPFVRFCFVSSSILCLPKRETLIYVKKTQNTQNLHPCIHDTCYLNYKCTGVSNSPATAVPNTHTPPTMTFCALRFCHILSSCLFFFCCQGRGAACGGQHWQAAVDGPTWGRLEPHFGPLTRSSCCLATLC